MRQGRGKGGESARTHTSEGSARQPGHGQRAGGERQVGLVDAVNLNVVELVDIAPKTGRDIERQRERERREERERDRAREGAL